VSAPVAARGCRILANRAIRSVHPGAHARTRPDHPAIITAASGTMLTYRQLDEGSNRAAQLFRTLGLRPGDGIALLLENHPRFYEIVWGAQRGGLYYTPMSTRLTPGEIEYIVGDCDAKALVTSAAMGELATALVDRMPGVTARLMLDGTRPGYASWEDAVAAHPPTPIADEVEGSDLLYSSGTTGRPKGVKLPLRHEPLGTPNALVRLRRHRHG
jgi:acyl-CoA synthetase (AMP-forming)/AMP-acid ligase II